MSTRIAVAGLPWPLRSMPAARHCDPNRSTHEFLEIDLYAALPGGLYRYDPLQHQLLITVLRAWIDRHALARAMGLSNDEQVLVAQTVGRPVHAGHSPT